MANYIILNLAVLLLLAGAVLASSKGGIVSKSKLASLTVLIILTAVFDNFIIMADIVRYNPDLILGIKLIEAPIEDFAYTIGAVFFVPFVFEKIRSKYGNT